MKNRIIYILISLFIFNFAILGNSVLADTTTENIELIILFDTNNIDNDVENIVINSGGKIINEFPDLGGIEVKCPVDLIPEIKSINTVQSLSPSHLIKLSTEKTEKLAKSSRTSNNSLGDLYEIFQWDIKRVTNNGESFNIESGNHNVIVGILDSGVDKNHPDLINNFLGGKNLIPAHFKDDSSESGDLDDINDRLGHGTNVAGIIAANGRIKGVAPNIGFKSYRIFNKNGETNASICSSAIIDATNDGVKVINLSIGSYDLKGKCYWTDPKTGAKYNVGDDMSDYSLLKRAIRYATKNNVTVVTSAGNECLDCSNNKALTNYLNNQYGNQGFSYTGLTYEAPGDIKDVITVSATNKEDKLTSYSNFGRKFIDITAPGGDMSKTSNITDMCLTTTIDSGYDFTEGTSISAPKVAAVAALIICKDNNTTPKSVAKKIYKTAEKLDNGRHSEYYGAGMINAYNALK